MELSQTRSPRLWLAFQYLIGGTRDKQRLCLMHYKGHKRVIEVGCSAGNIAPAFIGMPSVDYVGVDIDCNAIAYATRRFSSRPNARFLCADFIEFAKTSGHFDYILFAGSMHHMEDNLCRRMLESASRAVSQSGLVVVVDLLLPRDDDPWFVRKFISVEKGEHVRDGQQMRELLGQVPGLAIEDEKETFVGATPLGLPVCARFGVYSLRPV